RARGRALEQQRTLARISCERGRAFELGSGFLEATELGEEVAAHARQEVVILERGLRRERVHQVESRLRTERHRYGDRSVQLDDGRGRALRERVIENGDARPVRLLGCTRPRVTRGNGGLESVR